MLKIECLQGVSSRVIHVVYNTFIVYFQYTVYSCSKYGIYSVTDFFKNENTTKHKNILGTSEYLQ